ncbi:unnamed protein product [Closterium sp. NIES-64]|nr:unnamed protein product [Closterium sp. NIES-64]
MSSAGRNDLPVGTGETRTGGGEFGEGGSGESGSQQGEGSARAGSADAQGEGSAPSRQAEAQAEGNPPAEQQGEGSGNSEGQAEQKGEGGGRKKPVVVIVVGMAGKPHRCLTEPHPLAVASPYAVPIRAHARQQQSLSAYTRTCTAAAITQRLYAHMHGSSNHSAPIRAHARQQQSLSAYTRTCTAAAITQRLYAHMHGSSNHSAPIRAHARQQQSISAYTRTCTAAAITQRLYAHMHGSSNHSAPIRAHARQQQSLSAYTRTCTAAAITQRLYAHMHGSSNHSAPIRAHARQQQSLSAYTRTCTAAAITQRLYAHMHGSSNHSAPKRTRAWQKHRSLPLQPPPCCALLCPLCSQLCVPLIIRQWENDSYAAAVRTRSGKTTLIQRLNAHMHGSKIAHYLINLDPAVPSVPYLANIDIRDTVNYKNVMKEYGLGPNGAILTSLNLFTTKIDEVITLVERRADTLDYVFIDTPGQIEIFTWSASGAIITEAFASTFPTAVCFVVDTPRAANPGTFISSMLYACGILYKTRLPLLLAFNKTDVARHDFAVEWMRDFEAFQAAVDRDPSYAASLSRSLCLALDEFYSNLHAVGVSAVTGGGINEFFTAVEAARKEYMEGYRVDLEKMRAEKEKKEAERQSAEMARSLKRRFKLRAYGEYKQRRTGKMCSLKRRFKLLANGEYKRWWAGKMCSLKRWFKLLANGEYKRWWVGKMSLKRRFKLLANGEYKRWRVGKMSLKRRFKLLANGEYKRWRAGKRHNASTKTKKQRRQLRQPSVVPPGLKQPMRYLGFKR